MESVYSEKREIQISWSKIWDKFILVAGIPDRRNPLKNDDNRIYEIWLCIALQCLKLNILLKLRIIFYYGSWGVDTRSRWNNSFIEVIRQQNAYMSNVKQL